MEDAVAFCTDFIAKYRQTQTHIDYYVTEDSIKIFFILNLKILRDISMLQMN